ncbi:MAG: membrane protein insertase YidC [Thermodesulfobacteriota bacterium]|nr:membrane protein insertase YidC [Thermodesulfobacteriota bacterium]
MNKNAILAIILTFAVIFFWGIIQSKFFPQPSDDPSKKEVRKEEVVPPEKRETKPLKEGEAVSRPKVHIKKETSIETSNYLAIFTSEGARLKHFKLEQYEDRVKESSLTISLTRFFKNLFGGKAEEPKKPEPLDLVNTNEGEGLPLGLVFHPSSGNGGWEVDKEKLRLLKAGEKGEVTFSKVLDNELIIFKKYRFTSENNAIDLEVEIQNKTSKEITTQLGLEWVGKVELEKFADEGNKDFGLKYAFLKNQKVERTDLGGVGASGCTPGCGSPKRKIEPFESSDQGAIGWYAFEGEYFTTIIVPPSSEKNVILSVKGDDKNILKALLTASPFSVPPQGAVRMAYRIYLGPKEIGTLKELGVGAEGLIDFGFFTIIAKPLLWFLKLTHGVTKNFGIDIIILSILIKIIFLPLTQISFKSMKEMQKVGPEMARLKEQYKNDKARLQQETMLLYKRRKINPMSGCLPMLIQIPVFIALYNALQNTIEMRHAPFLLWIMDLSAKDPIYITPIIMGATMVLQQKMTPTVADPAQAKLFMLMPIMFTFLFLSFPSGLVLYWLVTNVLSIAHQYYMNKN